MAVTSVRYSLGLACFNLMALADYNELSLMVAVLKGARENMRRGLSGGHPCRRDRHSTVLSTAVELATGHGKGPEQGNLKDLSENTRSRILRIPQNH